MKKDDTNRENNTSCNSSGLPKWEPPKRVTLDCGETGGKAYHNTSEAGTFAAPS